MIDLFQMSDIPATGPHDSAYPKLWDGLVFCSSPSRSGPTGLILKDFSGYGNDSPFANLLASSWRASERGYALFFDGTDERIIVGDLDIFNSPPPLTLSVWAKLDDYTRSLNGGVAKGHIFSTASNYSFQVGFSSGDAFLSIASSDIQHHAIFIPIGDNDWHLWTLTYDGINVRGYKDGIPGTPTTSSDIRTTGRAFVIGGRTNGQYSLLGLLGDVFFHNRALDPNEIMDMYLGAHPLTPIRGVVGKAPVSLLLRQSNMDGGMMNMNGGFA